MVMGHLGGSASVEIDAPLVEVWAVVQDVMENRSGRAALTR